MSDNTMILLTVIGIAVCVAGIVTLLAWAGF